jgi:periplasmic protein TonB
MVETSQAAEVRVDASLGHLSVHVEGDHPAEVPFLFEQQQKRLPSAFAASLGYHVVMAVAIILAIKYSPAPTTAAALLPDRPSESIIWLNIPGPGGGGGGGGNKMKEPPRKAELPGKEKITVPAQKPPSMTVQQQAKVEPPPIEPLNIPAKTLGASQETLPGAIEAPPGPPTLSQGTGSGGGAGTGTGTGIGPGTGSGLGDGMGGGTGGGVYQPGNGVSTPRLLQQKTPAYTTDAMRAKVQGTAIVDCVVDTSGTPTNCHISRSLDPTFGLDQEAVKAAQQWKFAPGMLRGMPVKVQVQIEMTFTLR